MKNGRLVMDGTDMAYISFGRGEKTLIMIPGLGDGLRTVKGLALPMAAMYRRFGRKYRVLMFSRKDRLAEDCTTRDMAADVKAAMDALGVEQADVLGVSQGGMIAQHLAADFPERVGKLVLAVTAARPNPVLIDTVERWMAMAEQDDYPALMEDNFRLMYTENYLRKYRWLLPAACRVGKPASWERFLIMARACLTHNGYERLGDIRAKTLVVGGALDDVLTGEASAEIAEAIPGSRLLLYPDYGHALYQEAPDFEQKVLEFLMG